MCGKPRTSENSISKDKLIWTLYLQKNLYLWDIHFDKIVIFFEKKINFNKNTFEKEGFPAFLLPEKILK
jgi:hypothetical protein